MGPVASSHRAPSTVRVAELIRKKYLSGKGAATNGFLPGERDLARQYRVARVTVRRALGMLAADGLVRPEPGRGYRALPRANGLRPGSPAAYVVSSPLGPDSWTTTSQELAAAMQRVLLEHGWQALAIGTRNRSPEEIVRQLVEAGVWGVGLDSEDPALQRAVHAIGLPCVSLDSLSREPGADSILQDNHGGGMLAADFLLGKGHRRIAWIGPVNQSIHSLERFTGAQAAFLRRGAEFPREYVFSPAEAEAERAAREILARPDRPAAVLTLWTTVTLSVARAARSLGLVIGRDLDLVGWSTEHGYRIHLEREFGPGQAPPTVVWSTEEMARIAVTRLAWRLREPALAPLRISVPARLLVAGQEREHL
jgi:DNA-binding LacI/PurR family transcriptional regulator